MKISSKELGTIREKLRDDTTLLTEIEKRVQLYTAMQTREEVRQYIRERLEPVIKQKCKTLRRDAQQRVLFVCADAVEKLLLLQFEKYKNTEFEEGEMARVLMAIDKLCSCVLEEDS